MGSSSKPTQTTSHSLPGQVAGHKTSLWRAADDMRRIDYSGNMDSRVAGFNTDQTAAFGQQSGLWGGHEGRFDDAWNAGIAATRGTPAHYAGPGRGVHGGNLHGGIAAYRNPFQNDVISAGNRQSWRDFDRNRIGHNMRAAAAGSFGGSRHAIANAVREGDFGRNLMANNLQARMAGFDTAAGLAEQDRAARMSAFDLNNRFRADGGRQALEARRLGISGAQALSGIAGAGMTAEQAAIQGLLHTGGLQQALTQRRMDARTANAMRRYNFDWDRLNRAGALYGDTPWNQTTVTDDGMGGIGGLAGVLGTGLGIASMVSGAGGLTGIGAAFMNGLDADGNPRQRTAA